MTGNSDKNSSLIRSNLQSLVKAKNSIRVTDRILNTLQTSDRTWWNGLSHEWQETIYKSYKINFKSETFPQNLDDFDVSSKILDKMLHIEKLYCSRTSFSDYSPINKFHSLEELDLWNSFFADLDQINIVIPHLQKLRIFKSKINTIKPLVKARSLALLSIGNTEITEISPLASIQDNLCRLYIGFCQIGNEAISTLENLDLEGLAIRGTDIDNLSFIKKYSNLKYLDIGNTQLMESSPSRDVKTLKKIDYQGTKIKKETIQVLESLDIKKLKISDTDINDLSFIKNYSNLKWLDINNTPVKDISPLCKIKNIKTLHSHSTKIDNHAIPTLKKLDLEWLDISDTKINNLSFIHRDSNLNSLWIFNTPIEDISALFNIKNLEFLRCYNTKINREQILYFRELNPNCKVEYW